MFACRQHRMVATVMALTLGLAGSVRASDQKKAEKRLMRISAMASDPVARGIINQAMAEMVHAKRIELMRQRRAMNLTYGSLFIAHQLCLSGACMLDIALQLERGSTIAEIANEKHGNWKEMSDGARKLEDKIEEEIYRHFQHSSDARPVADEKYAVEADITKADLEIPLIEIEMARQVYIFWRNHAAGPRGQSLDSTAETILGKSADTLDRGDRH